VKLVVIDSIANLARDACELRDLTQRSQQMFQVSALMKEIASKYQVAVVVANQVVANINDIGSRNAKVSIVAGTLFLTSLSLSDPPP